MNEFPDHAVVPSVAPDRIERPGAGGAGEAGRTAGGIVEMHAICKSFYGVSANESVEFDLRRGEIHALLGENGAGKSTLCSILAGLYRPDSGRILIRGEEQQFSSPQDALAARVGMVYQHYRLVDQFTVAENLVLGHPDLPVRVSRRNLEDRARSLITRYRMEVDPRARVGDLSVGEQQRVEILKLLNRGVAVLILDEPTAVLTPQESEALFAAMRGLADAGESVIFVSHKLNEVLEVSNRVTILRDGRNVATLPTAAADRETLARLMVERENPDAGRNGKQVSAGHDSRSSTTTESDDPALRVCGLSVQGDRGEQAVKELSLDVFSGEILGVVGVSGNGQRELAEAIAGMRAAKAGQISIAGTDVTTSGARERADRGLGYVPEDRLATAVASGLTLEENVVLRSYWRAPFARGPFLSGRAIASETAAQTARFGVRGARRGLPVRILSGGNLQRAILARETAGHPRLLVVASPSRGLDVAATKHIRDVLREQRARGVGLLVISEDLEELLEIADRLIVLYEGRIVGEMPASDAQIAQLGLLMAGTEATS